MNIKEIKGEAVKNIGIVQIGNPLNMIVSEQKHVSFFQHTSHFQKKYQVIFPKIYFLHSYRLISLRDIHCYVKNCHHPPEIMYTIER